MPAGDLIVCVLLACQLIKFALNSWECFQVGDKILNNLSARLGKYPVPINIRQFCIKGCSKLVDCRRVVVKSILKPKQKCPIVRYQPRAHESSRFGEMERKIKRGFVVCHQRGNCISWVTNRDDNGSRALGKFLGSGSGMRLYHQSAGRIIQIRKRVGDNMRRDRMAWYESSSQLLHQIECPGGSRSIHAKAPVHRAPSPYLTF